MSIFINFFTFQKQLEAVKALQKLEELEDNRLLSKFVLVKDPANQPYLIEKSKGGFKYKEYLDGKWDWKTFPLEISMEDAVKSYGLGYQDRYIESIEKGIPAEKAVLVVSAYDTWSASRFKE